MRTGDARSRAPKGSETGDHPETGDHQGIFRVSFKKCLVCRHVLRRKLAD